MAYEDPGKALSDEEIGLGNATTTGQAVDQFTGANPAPPVDPAFPEPTGFESPAPPTAPLATDPSITPPVAPDNTLPSGLTGAPPAEALPPPAASVPTPNPGTPPGYDASLSPEDNRREAARRDLDEKKAGIEADAAKAEADAKQAQAQEAQAAHVKFQADRQEAQDRLDQKTAAYEANNKLVDPRKNVSVKSRLAVLFSGLGSAMAGGPYKNAALEELHKSWDEDTERQKANIAAEKDSVVMARTGLKDVDEGRRQLQESADAKNLATYNAALKQGQSQLANLGMDQAAIDSDSRIQALKSARAAAADKAAKDQDAHLLNQARIGALDAQAQKAARKGAGGGSSKEKFREDEALKRDARADDAQTRGDASGPLKEWGDEVKSLKAKGGLIETIHHGDAALKNISDQPTNPSTWVGAIDAAIKSNTGRSAVMSQYNLYMGHAAGKDDTPEQIIEKFRSGLPSEAQRAAILNALKQSNATLHGEASDAYENFRLHADDPRIPTNGPLRLGYQDLERSAFGTLPEYAKPKSAKAAPASSAPAATPAANVPASAKYTLAKQIVAPGSNATATQKANAQAFLDSVNGR